MSGLGVSVCDVAFSRFESKVATLTGWRLSPSARYLSLALGVLGGRVVFRLASSV